MILTGESGRKRKGGSFVNRNNDSNCRTGTGGMGHLSLGTMILGVERGGGSFVSRNYNSIPSAHREGEGRSWGLFVSV